MDFNGMSDEGIMPWNKGGPAKAKHGAGVLSQDSFLQYHQ